MTSLVARLAWARAAVAGRRVDPTAGHVLIVLASYANGDGWAWPGRDTLMAETGRGRVAVNDALTRLRAAGVVEHLPAAPGRPARYRLVMSAPDDPAPVPTTDVAGQAAASEANVAGPAATSDVAGQAATTMNGAGQAATLPPDVAGTWPGRGRNVAGQPAAEVEGEGEEQQLSPGPEVGRAGAPARETRANSISDGDEELEFAERLRGILQRGIDGLTTDEPTKRPTVEVILKALRDYPVPQEAAERIAVEVRSITQSQNRAPNVAALFARNLCAVSRRLEPDGAEEQP